MSTIDHLINQLDNAAAALRAAGVKTHPAPINEDGTLQRRRTPVTPPYAQASCLHCDQHLPIGEAWCDDTCRRGILLRDADHEPVIENALYTDQYGAVWRMSWYPSPEMTLAYRPGQEDPLSPELDIRPAGEVVRELGPVTPQTEWRQCMNCQNHVLPGQSACSHACNA